jgi:hypothetical protein
MITIKPLTFTLNLTLTYYFEALLLSHDVTSLRLCNVNKDSGGVNDPTPIPNFNLLL